MKHAKGDLSSLKCILKFVDIIGVIITLFQFVVMHDYSIGTIQGIISLILTVAIVILEDVPGWRKRIKNKFGIIRPGGLEKFILIFSAFYICFIFISMMWMDEYYEGIVGVFILIYGSPMVYSAIIIIIKIIDDNLKKVYLMIYRVTCAAPFLASALYVVYETCRLGFSLESISYGVSTVALYYPVFYVTGVVVDECSISWKDKD